jgi:hypothetical protein
VLLLHSGAVVVLAVVPAVGFVVVAALVVLLSELLIETQLIDPLIEPLVELLLTGPHQFLSKPPGQRERVGVSDGSEKGWG